MTAGGALEYEDEGYDEYEDDDDDDDDEVTEPGSVMATGSGTIEMTWAVAKDARETHTARENIMKKGL